MMPNLTNIHSRPDQPITYELRLRGHLDQQWQDWFDSASITLAENGETILICEVVDQAALHGLLRRVRDLGVQLIAVTRIEPDQNE